jgi:NAD(P)-dependent dehydrogenase (short-subunit alcohol dehydrogenase family)
VTEAEDVATLVRRSVETYGRLDVAFTNVGFEGQQAATAESTEENWERVVAGNLKSVWLCMKYEISLNYRLSDGLRSKQRVKAGASTPRWHR